MRLQRARIAAIASLVVLAAACGSAADDAAYVDPVAAGPVARAFDASSAKAGVPRDLLVAIARVEEGLDLPAVRVDLDVDNDVPAAGPLQLRRGKLDTLARGAALAGVTELELRVDADLALQAGALVLAELGAKLGARADDLASWYAAVEELSGFADDAHRESYAHQVFATLARGGRFAARDGEVVSLARHDELPPSITLDVSSKLRPLASPAQYAEAEWIPTSCTNKCTPGRDGAEVDFIVVHDTEGGWNASVATLQNDPNKSVQYIVGTDGRVGQFVTEETTAWHAGNRHYNQRSIGIEHVGYANKPFAEAEYAASAKLVDHLANKYKLPRDRAHVIGHDQIPNGNKIPSSSSPCALSPKACQASVNYGGASAHHDPGVWEWPTFMVRFAGEAKCNDVTAIWNCSDDKKKAFRCAAGKVEVATCDGPKGCEVMPNGVDDACDVAPRSSPPPVLDPPGEDAPPTRAPETTAAEVAFEGAPAPEGDAGCAVAAPARRSSGVATSALLGLALASVAVRRRRRP